MADYLMEKKESGVAVCVDKVILSVPDCVLEIPRNKGRQIPAMAAALAKLIGAERRMGVS